MKFAISLEYDGSRYAGWQRQHHSMSVQQRVEEALSGIANQSIAVVCSGRTDAGVHARCQWAHFETPVVRPNKAWQLGGNSRLPTDISIQSVCAVSDDFHARYSALERSYQYCILNSPARSALMHNRVAVVHGRLDEAEMHQAAQALVGEHDFSSFRAAGCQARHAVREISKIQVQRSGNLIEVNVTGNAFLHNMIRIIVGSLVRVGQGLEGVGWIAEILSARDRQQAGVTLAPSGLYFLGARYADVYGLPSH